jgi:hydrogenase maturation protease
MILIIGYGNSLRGDDGAGLVLAERLEEAWQDRQVEVERLALHQLTPELILEISREEVTSVVFVDTRAVPPEATDLQVWISPLQAGGTSPSLGHHLDPAALLALAGLLYDKWLPAWLVTVPGVDFTHREALSPTAQQALVTAPELSTKLLEVICV